MLTVAGGILLAVFILATLEFWLSLTIIAIGIVLILIVVAVAFIAPSETATIVLMVVGFFLLAHGVNVFNNRIAFTKWARVFGVDKTRTPQYIRDRDEADAENFQRKRKTYHDPEAITSLAEVTSLDD